jgi:hypothetical protein
MAKGRNTQATAVAESPEKSESVMGYFRRLLLENPRWLGMRSNKPAFRRWLEDHPDQSEVPANVRNALANVKSTLRKKKGKRRRAAAAGPEAPTPQPAAAPRPPHQKLERLENEIDECLSFAKALDRDGLQPVIQLLRRARNAVVWKTGP